MAGQKLTVTITELHTSLHSWHFHSDFTMCSWSFKKCLLSAITRENVKAQSWHFKATLASFLTGLGFLNFLEAAALLLLGIKSGSSSSSA